MLNHVLIHLGAGQPGLFSDWNQLYFGGANNIALTNSDASATGATFGSSPDPTAFPTPNTSGRTDSSVYPPEATSNSIYISNNAFNSSPTSYTFTLAGLDPAKQYDFIFYASRDGVADVRTTNYNIGASTATLDASNNQNNTATLTGVSPNGSGVITITMTYGAGNTNGSQFGYLSVIEVTENTAVPDLTLAFNSATNSHVVFTRGGGNGNAQLHRMTTAGASLPGTVADTQAGTTLTDSGATAGLPYFYKATDVDGRETAQVIAGLDIATTSISGLSYQSGPVVLGYIGSSTWDINQGSGRVPTLIESALLVAYPDADITTVNGAVSGTTTANFLPGQSASNSVKSAMQAATGYKVLRLMIGSNNATGGSTVAQWAADMQIIIADALTWPVDKIIIEETGIRTDGGDVVINRILQYNASRGGLTGCLVGTAVTFVNQANDGTLSGDNIHQTDAGQINLANEQAIEVGGLFSAPPDGGGGGDGGSPVYVSSHIQRRNRRMRRLNRAGV